MKHPLRRIGAGLAASAAATLMTLTLAGCPDPVDWSDYDGVNLIEARDFDAVDGDGTPLWYFSDGLTTSTGGDADFVTWEEVPASVYGSLPSGVTGVVYRLEVNNLLPNGDFEDTNLSAWALYDDPDNVDTPVAARTTSGALSGSASLSIDFAGPKDRFYVDLSNSLVGGFAENTRFAFHVEFKMPVNTFGLEINNGTTGDVQALWQLTRGEGQSESVIYQFPGAALLNPASFSQTNDFNRGSDQTWTQFSFSGVYATPQARAEGLFDEFRIVRADQGHYARLPVPYRDSLDSARPPLASGGTYTISVWVKPDPTAGSNNRIPARLFSAGLDTSIAISAITPGRSITVATDGPENLEALSDWTQLTFDVPGSSVAVTNNTSSNDVLFDLVFEVGRYAGGAEYADAGSILLAGPHLEWSPR